MVYWEAMKTIKSFVSKALMSSAATIVVFFLCSCSKEEGANEPINTGVKPPLSRMEDPAYLKELKGHQDVEQLIAKRMSLLRAELQKEAAKPDGERDEKKISSLEKKIEETNRQFAKAQRQARATVANRINQDLNQKKGN